jgi:hypothetical protein
MVVKISSYDVMKFWKKSLIYYDFVGDRNLSFHRNEYHYKIERKKIFDNEINNHLILLRVITPPVLSVCLV